ncbi:MAG: hypothetical protein IJQ00_13020, partial [Kiritimatiellae bacterium]|nr:hypothetical protein [Kiritimatiellia bacterium]
MSSNREIESKGIGRYLVAVFASCAACSLFAEDVIADEAAELIPTEHKLFSFNAYADVETPYICRGYIWD